jgi:hypothetical protein
MAQENQNKMRIASIVVMLKLAIIDGRMPNDWDGSTDTDLVEYLNDHYTITPKTIDDHIGI